MNFYSSVYYYFKGSLKIETEGEFPERLFNILAANQVRFWNVKKSDNKFSFYIKKCDILRLKSLRRKIGVKVKIVEKRGFPQIVKRYRYRYGIVVGAILFITLINLGSARLWNVEISGNSLVNGEHILNFLKSYNIKVGVPINKIDIERLEQLLILSSDNISWASLNIQGSVLQVKISEFDDSKTLNKTPCNLTAKYDGIISEINLNTGRCVVNVGDTVTKGQVLVSGIITENNQNNFIASSAQIYAVVPDTVSVEVEKTANEKIFYKTEYRRVLELFSVKMPLYLGDCQGNFEKKIISKNLKIFGGKVPIKFYKAYYDFYYYNSVKIDDASAIQIGRKKVNELLAQQGAKNIEFLRDELTDNGSSYIYKATVRKNIDITNKDFLKISGENN